MRREVSSNDAERSMDSVGAVEFLDADMIAATNGNGESPTTNPSTTLSLLYPLSLTMLSMESLWGYYF